MSNYEEEIKEFRETYGCSADHFLKDEYSICREERQYAVLLYNILRYYRKPEKRETDEIKRIFNACRIPDGAEIVQVFYEATFMRDFFERNRRIVLGEHNKEKLTKKTFPILKKIVNPEDNSFNYKLLKYVHKCCGEEPKTVFEYSDKEYNLGRNEICTEILEKEKFIVRWMMEAKPDIAVIYKKGKKKYLLFLECKFGSGESYYSKKDSQGNTVSRTQREIQWRIADFLCKYYLEEQVSDEMRDEESCLVRFVRSKSSSAEEISICDLIEMNKGIFGEDCRKDREMAEKLIKKGKMSLEDIADCVPSLSLDELKGIEAELMQMA